MALKDIIKFQLKRVNPFQGLVIDADIWQDAHKYHRDQQRLHTLVFHKVGIVEGLEVIANNPPDLSVNIHPGIAIDPEGNVIIVSKTQRYRIQSGDKGIIHLIIQFREVPSGPNQPPEGGQPTRILEAYRIQEREKLPDEPYLELTCIDFDPAQEAIKDAKAPSNAGKNEINLSFRQVVTSVEPEKAVSTPQKTNSVTKEAPISPPPVETITIGHAVLSGDSKDLHCQGLKNLAGEINRQGNFQINLVENIPLDNDIKQYTMIYLTGDSQFELTTEQQAALGGFLQSGGVVFGEGCSLGQEDAQKGGREFGLAFNQLASQLKRKLEIVQRGHPLLSAIHIFSVVPDGAESGMLLEGGGMVYSGSDYGCAWQGGHQEHPLPRDIIRNSIEMGNNIIAHARMNKAAKR